MPEVTVPVVGPELAAVDLPGRTADEVIERLGALAVAAGYVTGEYVRAVAAREATFPTGLPTHPVGVAIPHADPDGVHRACVAVARTAEPVPFAEMGSAGTSPVPVRLVFLLALEHKDQTGMLARLVGAFADGRSLTALLKAPSAAALASTLETVVTG